MRMKGQRQCNPQMAATYVILGAMAVAATSSHRTSTNATNPHGLPPVSTMLNLAVVSLEQLSADIYKLQGQKKVEIDEQLRKGEEDNSKLAVENARIARKLPGLKTEIASLRKRETALLAEKKKLGVALGGIKDFAKVEATPGMIRPGSDGGDDTGFIQTVTGQDQNHDDAPADTMGQKDETADDYDDGDDDDDSNDFGLSFLATAASSTREKDSLLGELSQGLGDFEQMEKEAAEEAADAKALEVTTTTTTTTPPKPKPKPKALIETLAIKNHAQHAKPKVTRKQRAQVKALQLGKGLAKKKQQVAVTTDAMMQTVSNDVEVLFNQQKEVFSKIQATINAAVRVGKNAVEHERAKLLANQKKLKNEKVFLEKEHARLRDSVVGLGIELQNSGKRLQQQLRGLGPYLSQLSHMLQQTSSAA